MDIASSCLPGDVLYKSQLAEILSETAVTCGAVEGSRPFDVIENLFSTVRFRSIGPMTSVRRSRLSLDRERELLDTALALVRERGFDRVTIDDIAAATRSSTATLYRRWGSKARMVISAIRAEKPSAVVGIDTGTLRGDLLAVSERAIQPPDPTGASMTALAREVLRDPELREALHELIIEPEVRVLRQILARHVDAGTIAPGNPVLDLVDRVLLGPVLLDQLYLGRDPDLSRRVVDDVLLPLLTTKEA
jgi:AcrR family transcriptional regulator